jgi:hypothetical protein
MSAMDFIDKLSNNDLKEMIQSKAPSKDDPVPDRLFTRLHLLVL